jgi:hypothetical protein
MRNVALLLFFVCGSPVGALADQATPLGKKVVWEPAVAVPQKAIAESIETPNQRRRRVGETIEASFPAEAYGEALETPNQRRKRLGPSESVAKAN